MSDAPNDQPFQDYRGLALQDLRGLAEMRAMRRAANQRTSAEMTTLSSQYHAATAERAQQRHRLMLLTGGALVLMAPLVSSEGLVPTVGWFLAAAICWALVLVLGAALDLLEYQVLATVTSKLLLAVSLSSRLELTEDVRLSSALQGQISHELDDEERRAQQVASAADKELARTKLRYNQRLGWAAVVFHLLFVAGVVSLLASLRLGLVARNSQEPLRQSTVYLNGDPWIASWRCDSGTVRVMVAREGSRPPSVNRQGDTSYVAFPSQLYFLDRAGIGLVAVSVTGTARFHGSASLPCSAADDIGRVTADATWRTVAAGADAES